MNLSDIKRIEVIAGPGNIAYHFFEKEGIFTIWVGEWASTAPRVALRTRVNPGNTMWSIEEVSDEPD